MMMNYIGLILILSVSVHTFAMQRISLSLARAAALKQPHALDAIATEHLSQVGPSKLTYMLLTGYPKMPQLKFPERACDALADALRSKDAPKQTSARQFLQLMGDMYAMKKRDEVSRLVKEGVANWTSKNTPDSSHHLFYNTLTRSIKEKHRTSDDTRLADLLRMRNWRQEDKYDSEYGPDAPVVEPLWLYFYLWDKLQKACTDYYCDSVVAPHVILERQMTESLRGLPIIAVPEDMYSYDPLAVSFALVLQIEKLLVGSEAAVAESEHVKYVRCLGKTTEKCGLDAAKARITMLKEMKQKVNNELQRGATKDEKSLIVAYHKLTEEKRALKKLIVNIEQAERRRQQERYYDGLEFSID